jgi:hypothetical protein
MYAQMRRELDAMKGQSSPRFIGSRCSYYDCPDPKKPGSKWCLRHDRLIGGAS